MHFIYWAHAYWKGTSGTIMVGLGGLGTIILTWDRMTTAEAGAAVVGLTLAMMKALDMFLDQTFARLAAGKTPIKLEGQNGHDTTHVSKSYPGQ